jgi:hypothetical protein
VNPRWGVRGRAGDLQDRPAPHESSPRVAPFSLASYIACHTRTRRTDYLPTTHVPPVHQRRSHERARHLRERDPTATKVGQTLSPEPAEVTTACNKGGRLADDPFGDWLGSLARQREGEPFHLPVFN